MSRVSRIFIGNFPEAEAAAQAPDDQEQEGFRFYADGTESGSSTLAAQDTMITRDSGLTTHLRILLNNTGDFGAEQVQLEDAEDGVEDWRKVTT